MAAPLVTNCPHCRTKQAACNYIAEARVPNVGNTEAIGFYQCNSCYKGISVHIQSNITVGALSQLTTSPTQVREFFYSIYPEAQEPEAPEHIPDGVREDYLDAQFNLVHQRWNSAGMGFRRTLDVATKELWPHVPGMLAARLRSAHEEGLITDQLHDLSSQIRQLGNDANHEVERFSEDDAKDIAFFTEMLLTYTYTLPGMITLRLQSGGDE